MPMTAQAETVFAGSDVLTLAAALDPESTQQLTETATEETSGLAIYENGSWRPALYRITSPEQYRWTVEKGRTLKFLLKGPTPEGTSVEETFSPLKKLADKLHKAICGQETKHAAPLKAAIACCASAVLNYDEEQEAKRRAEEKRLRDLQLEQQRKEQEQLDLERQQRQQQEQRRLEAEQAEAAEIARASGFEDVARSIEQQTVVAPAAPLKIPPPLPPPSIVPSTVPKVNGKTKRRTWKFRITNPDAIPRAYLIPRDPYDSASYPRIGELVRSQGDLLLKINTDLAGAIEVYEDKSITFR